jgi:hypothetical protein
MNTVHNFQKVRVPPKDEPDQNDGIKIEIVKEGV